LETRALIGSRTWRDPWISTAPEACRSKPPRGALDLIAAIVRDAVRAATEVRLHRNGVTRSDRAEAREWLASLAEAPWSFAWCCSLLGLDRMRAARPRSG
jgi:hypothetical protein